MGKSAKKTVDSTANSNYSSGTTGSTSGQQSVDVPSWLLNPAQQQAGQIGQLMNQGPQSFAPATSTLGQMAYTGAGGLDTGGTSYNGAYTALDQIPKVGAASVLDNLGAYQSPYTQSVVNSTLADFDENAAQQKAALAAKGAGGAFSGSRFGIAEGQLGGDLGRARATTESGLLDTAYQRAAAMSEADAGRRQGADTTNQGAALQRAQQLAALTGQQQGDIRSNLNLQSTMGAQQTAEENAARQYPLTFANQTSGLFSNLNPQSYFGQSSTGSSDSNTTGTEATTGQQKTTSDPGLLANLGSIMNLIKQGASLAGTAGMPGMSAFAGM